MDGYVIFCVIVQYFMTYFVFQIVPSGGGSGSSSGSCVPLPWPHHSAFEHFLTFLHVYIYLYISFLGR